MKRLTFEGNFCDIAMCVALPQYCNNTCSQREVWERLKQYEDAEAEGRLIVLPCKVGDTIYRCGDPIKKVYEWDVEHIEIYVDDVVFIDDSDNAFTVDDIGKTVFLTREEAEAALKGEKNDH